MYNFKDNVVVITGASGGLGKAVAKLFAENGAKLALFDLFEEDLAEVAREIDADMHLKAFDIACEKSCIEAIDEVMERFGRIDVLCNIAGISGPSARVEDYSLDTVKMVYGVNVFGTFAMMHHVLPIMQKQEFGRIINTGSVSGIDGYTFESGYGSSKSAVIELTKNAANENGFNNVTVNCVSPGWIDTQMMRGIVASYSTVGIEDPMDNVTLGPLGRACTAEEVAQSYLFLASKEANVVNGANLLADGGMILG